MTDYWSSFIWGILGVVIQIGLTILYYNDIPAHERTDKKKQILVWGITVFITNGFMIWFQFEEKLNEQKLAFISDKEHQKEKVKSDSLQRKSDSLQSQIWNQLLEAKENDKSFKLLQADLYSRTTGGDNYPIVHINASSPFVESNTKTKYHIIRFSLVNRGNYPLHYVKYLISDMHSLNMMELGIKVINDQFMGGNEEVRYDDINKPKFTFKDEIGSISNGESIVFYQGTICRECSFREKYTYNLKINWNGGYLYYLIHLAKDDNSLVLKNVELVFGTINGKNIKGKTMFSKLPKWEQQKYVMFN